MKAFNLSKEFHPPEGLESSSGTFKHDEGLEKLESCEKDLMRVSLIQGEGSFPAKFDHMLTSEE